MKISKYKVTIAVLAMALGTSLVSAQTGTQTPPPAKKPATSTATKTPAKPAGPGYEGQGSAYSRSAESKSSR